MDKRVYNRIKKNVGVLGNLKRDLNTLSSDLINQVPEGETKEQLKKGRTEAMRGNRSPAEAMLKNLRNKSMSVTVNVTNRDYFFQLSNGDAFTTNPANKADATDHVCAWNTGFRIFITNQIVGQRMKAQEWHAWVK